MLAKATNELSRQINRPAWISTPLLKSNERTKSKSNRYEIHLFQVYSSLHKSAGIVFNSSYPFFFFLSFQASQSFILYRKFLHSISFVPTFLDSIFSQLNRTIISTNEELIKQKILICIYNLIYDLGLFSYNDSERKRGNRLWRGQLPFHFP